MIAAVLKPPLWIELPAVVAGALAGASFAKKRGLDLIGILALALVSGLGGGIIRDVLSLVSPLRCRIRGTCGRSPSPRSWGPSSHRPPAGYDWGCC
jgi:hypothetical protein